MKTGQKSGLVLRADASVRAGSGHVMRCLALAQAWASAGGTAVFAQCESTPALEERLRAEGLERTRIVARAGSPEDALETAALAGTAGAEWVVVDGYGFDADYLRTLTGTGRRVLVLDDYGHAGEYCCEAVLNQNLHADVALYARRRPHTRLLLGTRFTLLRREFRAAQGRMASIPEQATRVLVTLGGSDPENITGKVIAALQLVAGLEAIVVVGGSNPHLACLEAALRGSPANIRLMSNVIDMSELMAWAHLAVTAGGSTAWELACLGVPALVLVLAENQIPVARALDRDGVAASLGDARSLTPSELVAAIVALAKDRPRRAAMRKAGMRRVDGGGCQRVVQALSRPALALRRVAATDARLLWEWANEPDTRLASFNRAVIAWPDHERWFAARLADPACHFFLACDARGEPAGQIRFDLADDGATASVSLAPQARGRGLGPALIERGVEELWAASAAQAVHAYIRPDNTASVRAFASAGFAAEAEVERGGARALHYIMRKECVE